MRVAPLLTICILAVGAITRGAPEQDSSRTVVVYALATGAQNAPVTDLTLADFTIKEDNRIREVTSVEPATAPLHVAVIVDDNGSGIFRFGVNNFAQRVQGRAEMSLRVVNGQVRTITEFMLDTRRWIAGISQLGVRPATQDKGPLPEGIADAAKSFAAREARRPVILALTGSAARNTARSSVATCSIRSIAVAPPCTSCLPETPPYDRRPRPPGPRIFSAATTTSTRFSATVRSNPAAAGGT